MKTLRTKETTPYDRAVLHGPSVYCAEGLVGPFLVWGSDIEMEAAHRMGTGRLDQRDYSITRT